MAAEDLSSPLQVGGAAPDRRKNALAPIVFGLAVLVAAGLVAFAALTDDPLGGEPVASAPIERKLGPPPPASPAAPPPVEAARAGVPVVSPGDPIPQDGPVIIRVPGAGGAAAAAGPAAPSPDLLESTKFGALPRIAADGRRPADLYARASAVPADRPKIAILIAGLGLDGGPATDAIHRLPGEITLGFSPYAGDLDRWLDEARVKGHESIVQLPMEPYDYPRDDPGPQTLLTSLPPQANLDRLRWAMARSAGYVGLGTYMGSRFTATEDALAPVLTEIARRGLVIVDLGSSPKSMVTRLAAGMGLQAAQADAVIDAVPDPAQIDGALAQLESLARQRGSAIGVASALPLSFERLIVWAEKLAAKGIALVPVSAVAKQPLRPTLQSQAGGP